MRTTKRHAALALLLLSTACAPGETKREKVPNVVTGEAGKTSATPLTIFQSNCALSGCHGESSPAAGMQLTPDAFTAQTVGVASSIHEELVRVVAGEPEESYLIHKVRGTHREFGGSGSRMPQGRAPLAAWQIEVLEEWVAALPATGTTENDADGDGYEAPADCNDKNAAIHPGATEIPGNAVDEDCSGYANDQDGDGYDAIEAGGDDADDHDATVYPGAVELCADGKDNDQNGVTDTDCDGTIDADEDGVTFNDGDCNDGDATIFPGATDTPDDGIDQDCDELDATAWNFSRIQNEIFTESCALGGCHSGGSPEEGMNLSAGNSYAAIVNVKSNQSELDRIEPGDPNASYLVHKIQGTQNSVGGSGLRMPRGAAQLSDEKINAIRNWVQRGALNE